MLLNLKYLFKSLENIAELKYFIPPSTGTNFASCVTQLTSIYPGAPLFMLPREINIFLYSRGTTLTSVDSPFLVTL